jgi:Asp-tRNA(Asn)/Glu-tRNA(Gln) amidotransferase A subunit family amidase
LNLPQPIAAVRNSQRPLTEYLSDLERRFDEVEPGLHAFMPEPGRFERLRRAAAELEARFPDPPARPPLFGVPVGVKDIFHVAGLPTTGGSSLPLEELQGPESEAVAALKAAGALILGKTVTTEFAYFGAGPTRNPHNPEHTPGGSSSGSAAAVAAGLCPLALGTQTVGSLIRPAAFCGVVGYKPSHGRVSTAGVIPLSRSVDHVGTLSADVAGAALAAAVLCPDWDAATAGGGSGRRPVLGVPGGPYLSQAGVEAHANFTHVLARLSAARYVVKRVPVMPDFDSIRDRHNLIVAAEAASFHAEWFARYRDRYHPKTVELIERGQAVAPAALAAALAGREALRAELTRAMDSHRVDLWLAPSAPGPAPRGLESTGDPVMNLPWTHSGLPAVGLPAGRSANGLPLGVQLIGRWQKDEALLASAAALAPLLV